MDFDNCGSCVREMALDRNIYTVVTGVDEGPTRVANFYLCPSCAATLAVEVVDNLRGSELEVACDALEAVITKRRQREAVAR